MRISCDLDGVVADMDSALAKLAEEEFGVSAKAARSQGSDAARQADDRINKADAGADQPPAAAGSDAATAAVPPADELPTAAVLERLTARQQTRLWQRVQATRNFWETIDECEPGAVRRFQQAAHQREWDVIFLTQRPRTAGRTVQLQSQRWLRRNGFELPSVYTSIGSRGLIAAGLTIDAHIDDRIEHCVNVASESKARAILVWRDQESFARISAGGRRMNIEVVSTFGAALDLLEEDEQRRHDSAAARGGASVLSRLKKTLTGGV